MRLVNSFELGSFEVTWLEFDTDSNSKHEISINFDGVEHGKVETDCIGNAAVKFGNAIKCVKELASKRGE